MQKKVKATAIIVLILTVLGLVVAKLDTSCMAHVFFERMTGHEYPKISNYHAVTTDEMNGTTSKDKEEQIKKLMQENKINGIVLFGETDKKPNIVESDVKGVKNNGKVTANVLFPIASLQKVYTGVAIQKLINQQKLSLDTPINKFYPNIPFGNKITVGDLLSHQSGIDDGNAQPLNVLDNEKSELSFVEKNLKSTGKVGKWNYSDSDYALLAGIVLKVSGMSYEGYVKKNFLTPLNLKHTKFYNQVSDKNKVISGNVENSGNALCLQDLKKKMSVAYGAGEIFSSAMDYWNFVNNLTNNKIIPLDNITSSQNHYYDGVYLGSGTLHADGSINGCQSCFITNYDDNQTFIFFANNISFKQMLKIRGKLADICFE